MKALVVVFVLAILALVGLVRHNTPTKVPPTDPSQNSFPLSPAMPTVDATAPESSQPVVTPRQLTTALLAETTDEVVTQSQLQATIVQVSNALRQVISTNMSSTNGVSTYVTRRYNNNIDQLTGTVLTDVTVNGISGLTAADIPTNVVAANYLPLLGGSVVGSLSLTDSSSSSVASLSTERTTDGSFTTDPSTSWTLGSGWSWDSVNNRASYTGTGGPISSISIDDGGFGYTAGDTMSASELPSLGSSAMTMLT